MVDTADSKSADRKVMPVRVRPPLPGKTIKKHHDLIADCGAFFIPRPLTSSVFLNAKHALWK